MGYTISIPFHAFRLRFPSGDSLWFPLQDKYALRLNSELKHLADSYAAAFQHHVQRTGQFHEALHEHQPGDFTYSVLRVSFEEAADQFTHPAFELEFDYLYQLAASGAYWGMVPVLGVEAMASTPEALENSLRELVDMDFSRNGRLVHLQRLISLIWFDTREVLQRQIKIQFPTPKELEEKPLRNRASWLEKIATQVPAGGSKPSAYCREDELKQLVRTLKSTYLRNVVLVGPRGVGKTALVWEVARRRQKLGIAEPIWEATASVMIKELSTETGWQENLSQLCQELQERKGILFVRNLYELFEVGKYEGNTVSLGDYLTPYISRGDITLIGECTQEERSRIDLNNPGFLSHFQLLQLEEPTQFLEEIILKKVSDIASDQKVDLSHEAIQELIRLNRRFTPYAGFPGKPIRFMESLLLHQQTHTAEKTPLVLDKSEIARHFCHETGMPRFMVDPDIPVDFDKVRERFAQSVYGQEPAVDSLINVLASVKTALSRTGKPIASFLFVGPTGVGKTELVKVLAEFMFGSRDRLTRFDMSEYSTLYAAMGLIGMEPGSEGTLINAVRREPFSVILFDEIEKAHGSFLDALLQILSEGRLTNTRGQTANFCSSIIILTSNIGAENLQLHRIGWHKHIDPDLVRDHFLQAVRKFFRPELFNRIDQVIPFQPLSQPTMRRVIDREIQLMKTREGIQGRKMSLSIGEGVLDLLAETGYNPLFGARNLQRTLQEQVAIPLARLLNQWDALDHVAVNIQKEGDQLRLHAETDPLSMDLLIEELEKYNLANLSADKRKEVQRLEEGAVFLKLTNELAILEQQKEKHPKSFWASPEKSRLYDQYQKTRERFAIIKQQITSLENEIANACMGFHPYQPILSHQVDEWKADWEQFRTELFMQLFPGEECWFSIYGKDPMPLIRLYHRIIRQKGFTIEGGTIWLTPHYQGSGKAEPDPLYEIPTTTKQEWLQLTHWNQEASLTQNTTAPNPESELYGVHWQIKGNGANWFFREESGLQRWFPEKEENKTPQIFAVKVANKQPKIPNNLHRKEFYQNKPVRRKVYASGFQDSVYKTKHFAPEAIDLEKVLGQLLEERLQQRIDEALF